MVNKKPVHSVTKRYSAPNQVRQSNTPYQEFIELRLQEKIVSNRISHLKSDIVYLKKMSDKTRSELKAQKTTRRNQNQQIIDLLTNLMFDNLVQLDLSEVPVKYPRTEKRKVDASESTDSENEWNNCHKISSTNKAIKDVLKQSMNLSSSSVRALLRKQ